MSSLVISLGILFSSVAAIVCYAKKTEHNAEQTSGSNEEGYENRNSNDFLDFSGGLLGI